MNSRSIVVLIYEEDAKLINEWTLQHPNIETGGDLFGLWQNESEVVVQLATGPGENCRRTPTSFFQDERYLGKVGKYVTLSEGMCNIGEWHSHHSLNLPEPSHGDKQTIWRHLPTYKINRFLLFIATIDRETGSPGINSFMFTSPENVNAGKGMFPTTFKLLPGPNPYRATKAINETLSQGAEVLARGEAWRTVEKKKRKKEEKRGKKKRKKEEKEEKKRKKREEKSNQKERKRAEKEKMKKQESEDENKSSSRKGFSPPVSSCEYLVQPSPHDDMSLGENMFQAETGNQFQAKSGNQFQAKSGNQCSVETGHKQEGSPKMSFSRSDNVQAKVAGGKQTSQKPQREKTFV